MPTGAAAGLRGWVQGSWAGEVGRLTRLDHSVATVYQDLAVVSLMEVWRNFFLGSELTGSPFPLSGLKIRDMKRITDEELRKMGIVVKDIDQPIGQLSGGQRECVASSKSNQPVRGHRPQHKHRLNRGKIESLRNRFGIPWAHCSADDP